MEEKEIPKKMSESAGCGPPKVLLDKREASTGESVRNEPVAEGRAVELKKPRVVAVGSHNVILSNGVEKPPPQGVCAASSADE